MSERRRSLFVLLIVVALIGGSIAVVADQADQSRPRPAGRCSARLPRGADRRSSRSSTPTPCSGRSTSCSSASTSSACPRPSSSRPARTRSRSTCRASRTPRRAADQVGSTAQLFFYDWEANILDDKCKTDPDAEREPAPAGRRPARGGRCRRRSARASGSARARTRWPRTRRAARRRPRAKPRFYVFDKNDEEAVRRTGRRSSRARTRWTR